MRFTQPGDLNDPFECLPVIPLIEETVCTLETILDDNIRLIKKEKKLKYDKKVKIDLEIRKFKSAINAVRKELPDNWREKFNKESVLGMLSKIGIVSFSKRWDSTLMWSHYASSHKGFCVGFDNEDYFFANHRVNYKSDIFFDDVKYTSVRYKVPTNKGESLDYNLMFTKSIDWRYEEEERLLISLTQAKKIIKKEGFDICLIEVPHKLIHEIIIGANCSESDINTVKKFCKEKNILLYKSKISDTLFDMTRNEI